MNKQERDLFYSLMESTIPIMSKEDQKKFEFIRTFLERRFRIDDFEDSFIDIERMGTKSLLYLIFAVIVEYDTINKMQ